MCCVRVRQRVCVLYEKYELGEEEENDCVCCVNVGKKSLCAVQIEEGDENECV